MHQVETALLTSKSKYRLGSRVKDYCINRNITCYLFYHILNYFKGFWVTLSNPDIYSTVPDVV